MTRNRAFAALVVALSAICPMLVTAARNAPSQTASSPAASRPPVSAAKATLADMAWLASNWEGRMGNSTLEERWTPAAGGAMLAVSRTVAGNEMVAFEFLRIIERDGTLVYVAQPNGRAPATEFTLTRIGKSDALFENPAHDYPKQISYSLAADGT